MPAEHRDDSQLDGSRRTLVVSAFAALLTTVLILPVSHHQLGASVSFLTAALSITACFELMSVYLLISDYRSRGDVRLLMMSWAYAWSLIVMSGYALAFPGAVSSDPPLAITRSLAPYFYVTWHCGFPVLLGAAWAPWPHRWMHPTPVDRRRLMSVVTCAAAVAGGALVVVALSVFAHHLPVLIDGLDTHRMTTLTAPITIPLVLLALALTVRGTRGRTGPERWSAIAVLICLCDLVLTYYSGNRFSAGWYTGRTLTVVAAGVLFVAMMNCFRRLKAQAELDAAVDALTGLANRRSAHLAFEQLIARSRRSGASLGVLSVDLDFFKRINDRYGHEAGDDVLVATAGVLQGSCRVGDVVARVGGEEFLILLPDTDRRGTIIVADKIRAAVAGLVLPAILDQVTVSVGATGYRRDDVGTAAVLRRADVALYQAKQSGRNRVVESPPRSPATPVTNPPRELAPKA